MRPVFSKVAMSKPVSGIRRLWNALHDSLAEFREEFTHETALRLELPLACVMIPGSFLLGDKLEITLLIGSVLLALLVELLDPALAYLVDRISQASRAGPDCERYRPRDCVPEPDQSRRDLAPYRPRLRTQFHAPSFAC